MSGVVDQRQSNMALAIPATTVSTTSMKDTDLYKPSENVEAECDDNFRLNISEDEDDETPNSTSNDWSDDKDKPDKVIKMNGNLDQANEDDGGIDAIIEKYKSHKSPAPVVTEEKINCDTTINEKDEIIELQTIDQLEKELDGIDQSDKELDEIDQLDKELTEIDQPDKELTEIDQTDKEMNEIDQPDKELTEIDQVDKELNETEQPDKEWDETEQPDKELDEIEEPDKELEAFKTTSDDTPNTIENETSPTNCPSTDNDDNNIITNNEDTVEGVTPKITNVTSMASKEDSMDESGSEQTTINDEVDESETTSSNTDTVKDDPVADNDELLLKNQIMDTEDLLTIVEKGAEDEKDQGSSDSSEKGENEDENDEEMFDSKVTSDDIENESETNEMETTDTERLSGDGEIDVEYPLLRLESDDHDEDKTMETTPELTQEEHIEEISTTVDEVTSTNAMIVEENDIVDDHATAQKRTTCSPVPESTAKKMKLTSDEDEKDVEKKESTLPKIEIMNALSEFMKQRTLKQITRKQLEHLCLQKICEAIGYKSEIGELRHQLQLQEQMIDTWRKDSQTLSKQTRDLEIVNRRLLSEMRQRFDKEKPIVPVKITRSVGLQVKLETVTSIVPRRRNSRQLQTTAIAVSSAPMTAVTPTLLQQVQMTQGKQVKLTTLKTTPTVALTNGTQTTPLPSLMTPTQVTIAQNPVVVGNSFIDLTDEDDKKVGKTQENGIIATSAANIVSSTAPRIMYFYSNQLPQGVLTQPAQKLMLKVNSAVVAPTTNCVTTMTVNGTLPTVTSAKIIPPRKLPPIPKPATPKQKYVKHPAPLPAPPAIQLSSGARKPIPPKPHLSIRRSASGIVLSWKMPYHLDYYEAIASYQLYAYQETNAPPSTDMWRKVGDVKALALPMACTLTQFADGNKYYFAVRAVDVEKRMGPFSTAEQIML